MTIREILMKLAATSIVPSVRSAKPQKAPSLTPMNVIKPPQPTQTSMTPKTVHANLGPTYANLRLDMKGMQSDMEKMYNDSVKGVDDAQKHMQQMQRRQVVGQGVMGALHRGATAAKDPNAMQALGRSEDTLANVNKALGAGSAAFNFAKNRQAVQAQAAGAKQQLGSQHRMARNQMAFMGKVMRGFQAKPRAAA